MTTAPDPTAELREAAERLRALLKCANQTLPWVRWSSPEHIAGWDSFLIRQPAATTALATWLDTEAATWAGGEVHNRCSERTCTLDAALTLAREINTAATSPAPGTFRAAVAIAGPERDSDGQPTTIDYNPDVIVRLDAQGADGPSSP